MPIRVPSLAFYALGILNHFRQDFWMCSHANSLLVVPADWKEIQSVPETTSQGKFMMLLMAWMAAVITSFTM